MNSLPTVIERKEPVHVHNIVIGEIECSGEGNSIRNRRLGLHPCKSKLQISYGNIFLTSDQDVGGASTSYTTIKCPVCHCYTDVKFNDQYKYEFPTVQVYEQRLLEQYPNGQFL